VIFTCLLEFEAHFTLDLTRHPMRVQARIATGRGAAGGVDDSLCEDDI
jgi:hypothetical protein